MVAGESLGYTVRAGRPEPEGMWDARTTKNLYVLRVPRVRGAMASDGCLAKAWEARFGRDALNLIGVRVL